MSIALDAAAKVHGKQIAAANKSEELVVRGLGKVSDLLAKSPDVPAAVSDPLRKVTSPVAKALDKQVSFANRTQDVVVEALEKRANAEHKPLQLPAPIARPIEKVSAGGGKLFGSPKDIAEYSASSARDWLDVRDSFQKAVRDTLVGTRSQGQGS
jgi:hypothetical protein